jgi:hypothetical protein
MTIQPIRGVDRAAAESIMREIAENIKGVEYDPKENVVRTSADGGPFIAVTYSIAKREIYISAETSIAGTIIEKYHGG